LRVLDYFQPTTLDEALRCLADSPNTTKVLAGGTDLIIQLRERTVEPEYILDLGGIKELRELRQVDGNLVIGSMTTFAAIEKDPLVLEYVPLLSQAAGSVGSPQIRNTGTIGGNLANAAPAADGIPALLALEAKALLIGGRGEREVAVADLLAGINRTHIADDEILCRLVIPVLPPRTCGTFVKLGRRKALAIARLNLALTMSFNDDGVIVKTALAVGAVGTSAYRVGQVEEVLTGKHPSPELFAVARQLIDQTVAARLGSRPTATYKRAIAGAALGRAFATIGAGSGRW
jgi:carbon-monoxide dehydrogenase medium subunit